MYIYMIDHKWEYHLFHRTFAKEIVNVRQLMIVLAMLQLWNCYAIHIYIWFCSGRVVEADFPVAFLQAGNQELGKTPTFCWWTHMGHRSNPFPPVFGGRKWNKHLTDYHRIPSGYHVLTHSHMNMFFLVGRMSHNELR